MNIIAIVGITLVSACLIVLIRKNMPEFAIPISVIVSLIILLTCVVFAEDIFLKIEEISGNSAVSQGNLAIIFKSLGVCYITQVGKDVCNDSGESALADKVDLAGKITIAAMSLGLITQVVELLTEIIEK